MIEKDSHISTGTPSGKRIVLSEFRWNLIIQVKHPEMDGKKKEIIETISNPDEIRVSKSDETVYVHYRHLKSHSLAVVIKYLNGDGFVITAYQTDRIKEGKQVYRK